MSRPAGQREGRPKGVACERQMRPAGLGHWARKRESWESSTEGVHLSVRGSKLGGRRASPVRFRAWPSRSVTNVLVATQLCSYKPQINMNINLSAVRDGSFGEE